MTPKKYFRDWIAEKSERDDPTGDFIEDVLDDSRFPRSATKWPEISDYLSSRNACREAKAEAWDLWKLYAHEVSL